MNTGEFKKLLIYLMRWQLSTLILWPCVALLPTNSLVTTIIANLIGGLIFFNIDKVIFKERK